MSDAITISMPAADVARVQAQMRRLETEVGKDASDALRFAAWAMARSMAGSTKIAPKLRPIVRNPDKRAGTDARVAPFGMYVFRKGEKVFKPLRGTGEFGKIRYVDRKTNQVMVRDRITGKTRRETFASGSEGAENIGLMKDKRRNIGRRGLAKAAWMWGVKALGSGGGNPAPAVAGIAKRNMAVTKRMTGLDMFVKFEDRLRYASLAFKEGEKAPASAAARAADNMRRMINIKLYGKKYAS